MKNIAKIKSLIITLSDLQDITSSQASTHAYEALLDILQNELEDEVVFKIVDSAGSTITEISIAEYKYRKK